ncbi:PspC domain-containing protein [Salinactinospora qingdaonensis]
MSDYFGKKELRRSSERRVLAGVCGGLGDFLGIDPNFVRLAFAVITLFMVGGGVFLYVLAWLIMPEEGAEGSVLEHIIRNFQGKRSDY